MFYIKAVYTRDHLYKLLERVSTVFTNNFFLKTKVLWEVVLTAWNSPGQTTRVKNKISPNLENNRLKRRVSISSTKFFCIDYLALIAD